MAAVLAVGFSTEKGDLSATAASNVNGPASQEAGLSPKTGHSGTGANGSHAGVIVTPTTIAVSTSTTVFVPPAPTPTTVNVPPTTPTTPTTVYVAPTPTTYTTSTTQPPSTQSIQLSCAVTGATQVTCTWTGSSTPVAHYALWRWTTGGNGSDYAPVYQSATGLTFTDNSVAAGVPYTYRVFTTLPDTTPGPFSNRAYVTCCS